MPLHQPVFACQFPELLIGQSWRHGGHSASPYQSLNLGLYTKDQPKTVRQNWESWCSQLQIRPEQVATSYQIHQAEALYVERGGHHRGYDALYTDQPGVFVAVGLADCTPILMYDAVQKIALAVHAGWRGTVANILQKTLQQATASCGLQPKNCWAFIGACISEHHFQVDADVADHFAERHKRWVATEKKFYVDLKAANREQLLAAGVPDTQIEVSPYCTVANNDRFFSHRYEKGVTGRMVGMVGVRRGENQCLPHR